MANYHTGSVDILRVPHVDTGTEHATIADDTYVHSLSLQSPKQYDLQHTGVSQIHGSTVLDASAGIEEHISIVPDFLATHRLTSCCGIILGVGKDAALKLLRCGVLQRTKKHRWATFVRSG